MNLDELAEKIRSVSTSSEVRKLADMIVEWKLEESTVKELQDSVERYLEKEPWENSNEYKKIAELWSSFRDDVIKGIGGMTMNERLFYFCLFDQFDACVNWEEKLLFYTKLHGKP